MLKTPKSLRLQIGLFGRVNTGKSAFLNYITNQDVSITSPVPGTTTDIVEKTMELLPIGPVLFMDTAGIDDISSLSSLRLKKTEAVFKRADIYTLIIEPGIWQDYEESIARRAEKENAPLIIVINKSDTGMPNKDFIDKAGSYTRHIIISSSIDSKRRNATIHEFKKCLIDIVPVDFLKPPPIIGDLMPQGGIAVLVVPIDMEAPKGRIILPQVQTIRDALDNGQMALVVKEDGYINALRGLKVPPAIVVCDSQVVRQVFDQTPRDIKCTTFSILFARMKSDLQAMARAARVIDKLVSGDKVLIAESCSHHPIEDDIGRVKIPWWIKDYTGQDIRFDSCAGRDFPDNLKEYKLIIQCGGCMVSRREMLARMEQAAAHNIAMTNYGMCISYVKGVLPRALSPFNLNAGVVSYSERKEFLQ
ncbi:MAG: [FeFe] hydrogenase H-cluster maturation GTPase HydF [Candidatus Omnitrophica bacterium]|nr:[FeFe] hydrogenase H-cluster maturation GTPase HydF [Candidatus Omnitrophota bacterium]